MNQQEVKIRNDTKRKQLWKNVYRCRALYLMILPAVIAVFIFHYIPLYGVQIAFKDYRSSLGIWGSEWVGFKHFIKFFHYPYFGRILWNTMAISLASLLNFPFPVIFAIMINEMRGNKLKKVCQTITYAPHFISTVLVCSMAILFLGNDGLFNIIRGFFGLEPANYMAVPSAFKWIYSLTDLWSGLGWGTIIYIATLAGVPQELIEAAQIDGAKRMQIIWNVHIPHLKPTIITMFILRMGSLLSVGFEKTLLLQNPLNLEASSVISTYVYQVGIESQQFSYSTAIGLFNSLINVVMLVTANTISKKVSDTGLW